MGVLMYRVIWIWITLLQAGSWTRLPLKIPSLLYDAVMQRNQILLPELRKYGEKIEQ